MLLEYIKERNKMIKKINDERIAKGFSELQECAWPNCKNLRDFTAGMGIDTACSYHRLLFDYWLYEISTEKTRNLSKEERNKHIDKNGQKELEKIGAIK